MESPPLQIADEVRRELGAERVLWAGIPDPWGYASRYWSAALFGIPFTAFSVYWVLGALQFPAKGSAGIGIFFPLWGSLFVGVGVCMLLSPFFMAWRSRCVYYVVTGSRAIIFDKRWKFTIHSFNATALTGFERVSSGGPEGSIVFLRVLEQGGKRTHTRDAGFLGLKAYAGAERALNQLLAGSADA